MAVVSLARACNRVPSAIALALLLAACGASRSDASIRAAPRAERESAPAPRTAPRAERESAPAPRTAPRATPTERPRAAAARGAAFDPREYYDRRALYVLKGDASYYADMFDGRSTANGERYDPEKYTAAHRSLPFGTILRVTRASTGQWVLVRVNDRGPFGRRKRILDLSKQAARRLGILQAGVTQVRAEVLELGARK